MLLHWTTITINILNANTIICEFLTKLVDVIVYLRNNLQCHTLPVSTIPAKRRRLFFDFVSCWNDQRRLEALVDEQPLSLFQLSAQTLLTAILVTVYNANFSHTDFCTCGSDVWEASWNESTIKQLTKFKHRWRYNTKLNGGRG